MTDIRVAVVGLDQVVARLAAQGPRGVTAMAQEMTIEAEQIMTEAKEITPVETGALRASGFVEPPVIAGDAIEVTMGFGGPAAPYAVYVHERPDLRHRPPTQWKFLETPALAAAPGMAARIAGRLDVRG